MHPKGNAVIVLRRLFSGSCSFFSLAKCPVAETPRKFLFATKYSRLCLNNVDVVVEEGLDDLCCSVESCKERDHSQAVSIEKVEEVSQDDQNDSLELFRHWGCTDKDISELLIRKPSLRKANVTQLRTKLSLLHGLGITSSDLVRIVNCRPRFLSSRINRFFGERIDFFMSLFGSKEVLRKAIVRNPSLLTYDLHDKIKPVVALYEGLGMSRKDLIPMLLSRPTLIPRTSFNEEKIEYICKTGVSKDSKMFKYVATLIGVSRMETIREKVANIEKFGFSEDEVWRLFGKNPLVLTLSVDRVQRNMTYILGTMKLQADVVLQHPFLLYSNLEAGLKPRVLLAGKLQDMGLKPDMKGRELLTALRMKEKRFLKVFVTCHPEEVAKELLELYKKAKGMKRLAEESKKNIQKGFPF